MESIISRKGYDGAPFDIAKHLIRFKLAADEPYASWGQMITAFFKPEIGVANRARIRRESLRGFLAAPIGESDERAQTR